MSAGSLAACWKGPVRVESRGGVWHGDHVAVRYNANWVLELGVCKGAGPETKLPLAGVGIRQHPDTICFRSGALSKGGKSFTLLHGLADSVNSAKRSANKFLDAVRQIRLEEALHSQSNTDGYFESGTVCKDHAGIAGNGSIVDRVQRIQQPIHPPVHSKPHHVPKKAHASTLGKKSTPTENSTDDSSGVPQLLRPSSPDSPVSLSSLSPKINRLANGSTESMKRQLEESKDHRTTSKRLRPSDSSGGGKKYTVYLPHPKHVSRLPLPKTNKNKPNERSESEHTGTKDNDSSDKSTRNEKSAQNLAPSQKMAKGAETKKKTPVPQPQPPPAPQAAAPNKERRRKRCICLNCNKGIPRGPPPQARFLPPLAPREVITVDDSEDDEPAHRRPKNGNVHSPRKKSTHQRHNGRETPQRKVLVPIVVSSESEGEEGVNLASPYASNEKEVIVLD
eukprot:comp15540_c0_seq1/m.12593 comp15540_c0_seq1/g.12593  ORF comp15540_c0_seq1/g.12593 comp15540_c0_seq1/m.12593 type:complete len:450 (-) comp15540_c0_seq1:32-1381(-)